MMCLCPAANQHDHVHMQCTMVLVLPVLLLLKGPGVRYTVTLLSKSG